MNKEQKNKLEEAQNLLQKIVSEEKEVSALFDVIEIFHKVLKKKCDEYLIKEVEKKEITIKHSVGMPFLELVTQKRNPEGQKIMHLNQLIKNAEINTSNNKERISHLLVTPVSFPKKTLLDELLKQLQNLNKSQDYHLTNLYKIGDFKNTINKKDLSTEREININE